MLGHSLIALLASACISSVVARHPSGAAEAIQRSHYTRAHSLGDGYTFDHHDGWESVNATDLDYKYKRSFDADDEETSFERRSNKNSKSSKKHPKKKASAHNDNKDKDSSLAGTIKNVVNDIWKGLRGIGKHEKVVITWYTGNDLKNPSCWANTDWTPTDASFGAALTLEGWTTRPKCFKFLERVCNGPKKCIFVRVIDTCAGCAKGSKHVDLTRAAFGELADWDEGLLNVQMRGATEPTGWYKELWGPKK